MYILCFVDIIIKHNSDNADQNASLNILERFLTGPYGAGFKLKNNDHLLVANKLGRYNEFSY